MSLACCNNIIVDLTRMVYKFSNLTMLSTCYKKVLVEIQFEEHFVEDLCHAEYWELSYDIPNGILKQHDFLGAIAR